MKRLILINGPMGAGKTTVTPLLAQKLSPAVWLDGDWCWKMEPFTVTEENKAVVLENIHTLLGNFLRRGSWETVLFCWVMDHPEILRQVLQPLRDEDIPLWIFTLTWHAGGFEGPAGKGCEGRYQNAGHHPQKFGTAPPLQGYGYRTGGRHPAHPGTGPPR